ncbi:uncharacterized protein [Solanum lycopersicum]|uniref:uncharacterized protein n=1 Tax=Solanum lycopersicum TaxID=4081 RepID=UPI0037485F74
MMFIQKKNYCEFIVLANKLGKRFLKNKHKRKVEIQQTCHRLQFNRNSSQSSSHRIFRMVRTRATTAPTPAPAEQGASEPTTGAVARGRAAARGRGRGRGRTSSRGRGRSPSPSDTRAVTPPPTEEVIREGEDGENEQVQNEGLPPQPTPEMINQVLAYLSELSDQSLAPPVFSAPTPDISWFHGTSRGNSAENYSAVATDGYNDGLSRLKRTVVLSTMAPKQDRTYARGRSKSVAPSARLVIGSDDERDPEYMPPGTSAPSRSAEVPAPATAAASASSDEADSLDSTSGAPAPVPTLASDQPNRWCVEGQFQVCRCAHMAHRSVEDPAGYR